jgi:RNA polymerase sigma factor (TIGR02999 family)
MEKFLIDYARERLRVKRGQGAEHVGLEENIMMPDKMSEEMVLLDQALKKLARIEERKARVVRLRYFGGFTLQEIASILEVAQTTVDRDWRFARSWLYREITGRIDSG